MTERAKYEKWLRDLEAKKDSTPAHVYERVRGDYTSRLDEVSAQLRQHTASMQDHARTLMTRLRELESAEQDLKDERAEQELRAQVGELTPGEWETISRKAQRALTKVKEDQEAVADDLNRIRELLEGDDAEHDAEAAPRRSTDFNELEFLKSVVEEGSSTAPSSSPARASGNAPRAATPASTKAIETSRRPTPAAPVAATAEKRDSAAVKSPSPEAAPPEAPAKPAAPKMQVTTDAPLTLRASGETDVKKTLKCPECGTMNSPNEWYCEKCGTELANI